jgi:hypothetical protein
VLLFSYLQSTKVLELLLGSTVGVILVFLNEQNASNGGTLLSSVLVNSVRLILSLVFFFNRLTNILLGVS